MYDKNTQKQCTWIEQTQSDLTYIRLNKSLLTVFHKEEKAENWWKCRWDMVLTVKKTFGNESNESVLVCLTNCYVVHRTLCWLCSTMNRLKWNLFFSYFKLLGAAKVNIRTMKPLNNVRNLNFAACCWCFTHFHAITYIDMITPKRSGSLCRRLLDGSMIEIYQYTWNSYYVHLISPVNVSIERLCFDKTNKAFYYERTTPIKLII